MQTAPALYNFTPLAWLLLAAASLALGPLAWVLWRNRAAGWPGRLRALTVFTLFLTFDLVLFGAFTRLTDSGLGCPDWPGCYGSASPLGAHAEISAAQSAMPTGPVTHGKAWVEMVHRYLAGSVGVLIVMMAALAWWIRSWEAQDAAHAAEHVEPWWPTFTLGWVCLQGAFGAWTVTMKLFPAIVTLHLAGGLVLLALLCAQAVRQGLAERGTVPQGVAPALRLLLLAVFVMVCLQVLLGGWVSTNYAVLACTDFPTCHGRWWPDMALGEGFQIWRPLGLLQDGRSISFAGLTAVHYVHRLFAYVVFVALGVLAWRLRRAGVLAQQTRWLIGLAFWQFATGLSNVVLDWPLVAAVSHTGGAAALVTVLTWALAASRSTVSAVHHGLPPLAGTSSNPSDSSKATA
jgi:heme a synthase